VECDTTKSGGGEPRFQSDGGNMKSAVSWNVRPYSLIDYLFQAVWRNISNDRPDCQTALQNLGSHMEIVCFWCPPAGLDSAIIQSGA
jgi:hypothetical protein